MYYYKHMSAGEVISLESRSTEAVAPSSDMIEITASEYEALMAEMFPAPDSDEISDGEALEILLGGAV